MVLLVLFNLLLVGSASSTPEESKEVAALASDKTSVAEAGENRLIFDLGDITINLVPIVVLIKLILLAGKWSVTRKNSFSHFSKLSIGYVRTYVHI